MAAPPRDNLKEFWIDFGSMPQENVSFQQLFDQALSAHQQKNVDEALRLYLEALDKGQASVNEPQTAVIYHNMSTLAYDKTDFLHAYVWSKKAVTLDPGNHLAQQALEQHAKKFEVPQVAHQISTFQNLQKFIAPFPIDFFFVITLILLFLTLRTFFKNLVQKRQNQIEMTSPPSFAWKPLISFCCFVLAVALTAFRWDYDQKKRAIVTVEKTSVQTAAGENKPIIYEAQPGTEVELLQISENYAQIRYPGAFSGWVLKKNLEILSR